MMEKWLYCRNGVEYLNISTSGGAVKNKPAHATAGGLHINPKDPAFPIHYQLYHGGKEGTAYYLKPHGQLYYKRTSPAGAVFPYGATGFFPPFASEDGVYQINSSLQGGRKRISADATTLIAFVPEHEINWG